MPIGVAIRSCGRAGRPEGRGKGISCVACDDCSPFCWLTGRAFGDGGMPNVKRGGRGPPLLRELGMGGLRRGAGDDMAGEGQGGRDGSGEPARFQYFFFFSKQTWPALREEIHQSRRKKDDNRWQSGLSVRGRFRSAAAREKSGEGSSID